MTGVFALLNAHSELYRNQLDCYLFHTENIAFLLFYGKLMRIECRNHPATHPERWRDRPDDTSATAQKEQVPTPAETTESVATWKMSGKATESLPLFPERFFYPVAIIIELIFWRCL